MSNSIDHSRSRRRLAAVWIAALSALPTAALAGPDAASVLPENTIAAFDWAGADAVGAAHAATAFGRALAEADAAAFVAHVRRECAEALRRRAAAEPGPAAMLAEPLLAMCDALWRRPWTLALLDLTPRNEGDALQLALVVDAGAGGSAVRPAVTQLAGLLARAGMTVQQAGGAAGAPNWSTLRPSPDSPPISWAFAGDRFVVAIGGEASRLFDAGLAAARHLSDHEEFAAVGRGCDAGERTALASAFLNVKRLRTRLLGPGGVVGMGESVGILSVLQSLGLDAVSGVGARMQLDGGLHRYVLFLHADGVKRGLLKAFDQRPIDDADLVPIPADARWAYVSRLDPGGVIDGLMGDAAAAQSQPALLRAVLEPLFNMPAGRLVRRELLPALGDTWVLFDSPGNGGILGLGATLCVRTRDAGRATRALRDLLEKHGAELGSGRLRVRGIRSGGHELFLLESPDETELPVAPAFAARGEWLVAGLYPQTVRAVLDRLAAPDARVTSIASSSAFRECRGRLPADANAMTYVDAAAAWDMAYGMMLPITAVLRSELARLDVRIDLATMPTSRSLRRHLVPTFGATVARPDGIQLQTFAAAPLLTPSIAEAAVWSGPLTLAVLMQARRSTSDAGDRTESLARMSRLVTACVLFAANDDKGRLPAALSELRAQLGEQDRDWFDAATANPERPTYVLVQDAPPLPRIANPVQFVLLYEHPSRHDNAGTIVAYADGHVAWRAMQAFRQDLERTTAMIVENRKAPPSPSGGANSGGAGSGGS